MALSYQQVVSDGALSSLLISLDYADRSEIHPVFDDGLSHAWSWVGSSGKQLTFNPPIPHGVTVTILRKTAIATARHKFAGGAQFKAKAVDEAIAQLLSAIQELKESSSGAGPASLVPWENIIGGPAAVAAYADAAAAAAAELARITAETYADGVVTEAEARAVAVAATEAELAETMAKAYADGLVTAEETRAIADAAAKAEAARVAAIAAAAADATAKANAAAAAAQVAAAADATAKANLATVTANAYADGVVDAEEARAIADATAKANAARAAAEAAAAADATAKANAAALTAQWSGVSGAGKPQDYATVGAQFGVNISGQINSGNVATYVAPGTMGTSQLVPGAAALVYKHTYGLTSLSVGHGTTTNLILDFVLTESTPVEITFTATCGNGDGPADAHLAVQSNLNGWGWVDLVPGQLLPLTYSDGASASRIVNVAFADLYTIPAGTIMIRTNVWTGSPGSWINNSTLRVGVIKR